MQAPWTSTIRTLRRRFVVATLVTETGRWLLYGAGLALAYVAFARWSYRAHALAPLAALVALVVLAVRIALVVRRLPRQEIYFAKWVDLASQLEDRLASSVEWTSLPSRTPFQDRCIEQLALELGAGRWRLVLPPTRPRHLPLYLASVAVIAAAVGFHLHRPAPKQEVDARQKVALPTASLTAASQQVTALKTAAAQLAQPELNQLTDDAGALLRDMERGTLDRETALSRLESLRSRAGTLKEKGAAAASAALPSEGRGPVAELARAASAGDAPLTQKLLTQLAKSLQEGQLSDEEQRELEQVVSSLAAQAQEVDAQVASSLRGAARALQAGGQAGPAEAATKLNEAAGSFSKVASSMESNGLARRTDALLSAVERALQHSAQGASSEELAAGAAKGGKEVGLEGATQRGSSGASSENPSERVDSPSTQGKGTDLQLTGMWKGAAMRQLFESSTGAGAGPAEVRQLLIEHERVIEERFRNDEVPREYEDAIRAYFAALHKKGSQ